MLSTGTYICCCISRLFITQVDEDVALLRASPSINEPASCGNQCPCTGRGDGCADRSAGGWLISPGWAGAWVRVSLPVQRCKRAVHMVGGLWMAKIRGEKWLEFTCQKGLCQWFEITFQHLKNVLSHMTGWIWILSLCIQREEKKRLNIAKLPLSRDWILHIREFFWLLQFIFVSHCQSPLSVIYLSDCYFYFTWTDLAASWIHNQITLSVMLVRSSVLLMDTLILRQEELDETTIPMFDQKHCATGLAALELKLPFLKHCSNATD